MGANDKRRVLYRQFHKISNTVYLVEISRFKLKTFIVLCEDLKQP